MSYRRGRDMAYGRGKGHDMLTSAGCHESWRNRTTEKSEPGNRNGMFYKRNY